MTVPQAQAGSAPRGRLANVSRLRAFLTHFAGSAAIVASVCGLIFFVWYPHPYFQAMGAWHVLRVLIGVDLVVGPLLTLIVFKPGKPGLKFDLIVIAAVQLAAFAYGVATIYRERPYFTVFAVDRFHVLARADVAAEDLAAPGLAARIGTKPAVGPLLVAATRPSDLAGMQRLLDDSLAGKPDIERRPEFWGRYADGAAAVIVRATRVEAFSANHPDATRRIAALAAAHGVPRERLGFVPVAAKNRDLTLVIDCADGRLLEIIDVDPWSSAAKTPDLR
jgi:hypothetical protein